MSSPTTTQLIMRARPPAMTWRCHVGFSIPDQLAHAASQRDEVGLAVVVDVGDHYLIAAFEVGGDGVGGEVGSGEGQGEDEEEAMHDVKCTKTNSPLSAALRFAVFAEDSAEAVGDFADGGVRCGGIEDGRHQVGARPRRPAPAPFSFWSTADALREARSSRRRSDLLTLERRIEAEGGDGLLVVHLESIDPHDDAFARLDWRADSRTPRSEFRSG